MKRKDEEMEKAILLRRRAHFADHRIAMKIEFPWTCVLISAPKLHPANPA